MGVGRMVDACRAQGVPEPEYEVAGGFVRIIFKRPMIIGSDKDDSRNGYVNGYVNGEVNTLTLSQKLVYDTVCDNPGINTKKIADILKNHLERSRNILHFWQNQALLSTETRIRLVGIM